MLNLSVKIHHTQGNHQCSNYLSHLQGQRGRIPDYYCEILREDEPTLEGRRTRFANIMGQGSVDIVGAYNAVVTSAYKQLGKKSSRTKEDQELLERLFPVQVQNSIHNVIVNKR